MQKIAYQRALRPVATASKVPARRRSYLQLQPCDAITQLFPLSEPAPYKKKNNIERRAVQYVTIKIRRGNIMYLCVFA